MTINRASIANTLLIAALLVMPPLAGLMDGEFYIILVSRALILAIGAVSLNLILGFGGMVSFGQAAFIGIGAYVVGAGTMHAFEDGIEWLGNGYVQLALTVLFSALAATVIGAISLRTKGVYFIMITLAFGQMLYFVAVGLEIYGGDDGLSLYQRSEMPGLPDLSDDRVLYYLSLGVLLLFLYFSHRILHSRFGKVLTGIRLNEQRMSALGFPTYRYRLTAFVIAGIMTGIAGFLLANQTDFISPAMMHWTRSGDLIIMIVLGGIGTVFGPVYGALAFLLLEEFLSGIPVTIAGYRIGEYWQLIFGPILILIILYARRGIYGFLQPRRAGK